MRVSRNDRSGTLRQLRKRADGSIVVDAHLTRVGVLEYPDLPRMPDGSVRAEYRPPEEVFAPAHLESIALASVTDRHPATPDGLLDLDTGKALSSGVVGEAVERDGDHVRASLRVYDPALIMKMQAGQRDVSEGYTCDTDESPGVTPDGIPYHAIQRNIVTNHVAIVDRGRAGSARVRMDGLPVTREDAAMKFPPKKKPDATMAAKPAQPAPAPAPAPAPETEPEPEPGQRAEPDAEPDADEGEGQPPQEAEAAADPMNGATEDAPAPGQAPAGDVGSVAARAASIMAQLSALIQEMAGAAGGPGRLDAEGAMADVRLDAARFDERVSERVELVTAAAPILGRAIRRDESDRDVREAVVKAVTGVTLDPERSDDYVAARFDAAIEQVNAAGASADDLARVLDRNNKAARDTEIDARAQMIAHNNNLGRA